MDPSEFLEIWLDKRDELRRRILSIIRNPDDTEDLLQEVFLKTYPQAHRLDNGAIKYLMRTASNLARDYIRNKKIWKMEMPATDHLCEDTPHDFYCKKEQHEFYRSRVLPALCSLPPKYQQALAAYTGTKNRRDYALQMGIPYSTLRWRMDKAIQKLRDDLSMTAAGPIEYKR